MILFRRQLADGRTAAGLVSVVCTRRLCPSIVLSLSHRPRCGKCAFGRELRVLGHLHDTTDTIMRHTQLVYGILFVVVAEKKNTPASLLLLCLAIYKRTRCAGDMLCTWLAIVYCIVPGT